MQSLLCFSHPHFYTKVHLSLFLFTESIVAMAAFTVLLIASLLALSTSVYARIPGVYTGGQWESAHATFYGGSDASGTMGIRGFLASFSFKTFP